MNKVQKIICKVFKIRPRVIFRDRVVYKDKVKVIDKLIYPRDSIIFEEISEIDTMDRMGVS